MIPGKAERSGTPTYLFWSGSMGQIKSVGGRTRRLAHLVELVAHRVAVGEHAGVGIGGGG